MKPEAFLIHRKDCQTQRIGDQRDHVRNLLAQHFNSPTRELSRSFVVAGLSKRCAASKGLEDGLSFNTWARARADLHQNGPWHAQRRAKQHEIDSDARHQIGMDIRECLEGQESSKGGSWGTGKIVVLKNHEAEVRGVPKASDCGCRLYTRQSAFLAKLADERVSMRLYLGQCMAYDEILDEVPERLRTWEWDEAELDKLCNFQWDKLDTLNHATLKLRAQKLGTQYPTHDADKLYRHEGLLHQLGQVYGKLFGGVGYPLAVPTTEGLSFGAFIEKIRGLAEMASGLTERESARFLPLVEKYEEEGFRTAAESARVAIYGASPGAATLGACISAPDPLLVRMRHTIQQLDRISELRVALPGVFGDTPKARMYVSRLRDDEKEGGGGCERRGG